MLINICINNNYKLLLLKFLFLKLIEGGGKKIFRRQFLKYFTLAFPQMPWNTVSLYYKLRIKQKASVHSGKKLLFIPLKFLNNQKL